MADDSARLIACSGNTAPTERSNGSDLRASSVMTRMLRLRELLLSWTKSLHRRLLRFEASLMESSRSGSEPLTWFSRWTPQLLHGHLRLPSRTWIRSARGFWIFTDVLDRSGRTLINPGTAEPELAKEIKGLVRRGDCFVEIGARNGFFSLLAEQLVGTTGVVVAFEPDPDQHHALLLSLSRNRSSVITYSFAITRFSGMRSLRPDQHRLHLRRGRPGQRTEATHVPGLSGETLLTRLGGIARPVVLKVDSRSVDDGFLTTLMRGPVPFRLAALMVEIDPNRNNDSLVKDLREVATAHALQRGDSMKHGPEGDISEGRPCDVRSDVRYIMLVEQERSDRGSS